MSASIHARKKRRDNIELAKKLYFEGYTRREIARELGVAPETVGGYLNKCPRMHHRLIPPAAVAWASDQWKPRPTLKTLASKLGVNVATLHKAIMDYRRDHE